VIDHLQAENRVLAKGFEDFGRSFFLEVCHWLGPVSYSGARGYVD
jgi:hypothetical protein